MKTVENILMYITNCDVWLPIICQEWLNKAYKGQSRDTGNIGHKTQNENEQNKPQHRPHQE
jgi:hypothetical protein